jgi:hypothetical protein
VQAEDLHESGGVLSKPGDSPVFPEDIDPFGHAGMAENVDVGEVKTLSINTHEQRGVLPVTGTAPALAKGTTGIKPASEAKRAITAKSEALAPQTQGMARHKVKRPLQEGKHVHEPLAEALPPKHEHKCGTTPQGNLNEDDSKPSWPS